MQTYKSDRLWTDRRLAEIESILNEASDVDLYDFEAGSFEEDTRHGIDLKYKWRKTFSAPPQSAVMALRLRMNMPYRDITIRSTRKGAITELAKIQQRLTPRWYFYGWIEKDVIGEWCVVDIYRALDKGLLDNCLEVANKDQTTAFIAVPAESLAGQGCVHLWGATDSAKLTKLLLPHRTAVRHQRP